MNLTLRTNFNIILMPDILVKLDQLATTNYHLKDQRTRAFITLQLSPFRCVPLFWVSERILDLRKNIFFSLLLFKPEQPKSEQHSFCVKHHFLLVPVLQRIYCKSGLNLTLLLLSPPPYIGQLKSNDATPSASENIISFTVLNDGEYCFPFCAQ